MGVLWGGRFLISEVLLYRHDLPSDFGLNVVAEGVECFYTAKFRPSLWELEPLEREHGRDARFRPPRDKVGCLISGFGLRVSGVGSSGFGFRV